MRKTALTLTITTLVISVFGAFLHWLQTMNAFEKDTGLAIRGAGTSIAYVIYTVLAAAAICFFVFGWLRKYIGSADAGTALCAETVLPAVLGWLLCICVAAPSCWMMFSVQTARFSVFRRVFGACGIIAGLSIPCLTVRRRDDGMNSLARPAAVILTLFYCLWLVFFYKTFASENPVVWAYAVETLGIASGTVGIYSLAAYYFGIGRKNHALVSVQLAVYFNLGALADEHNTVLSLMLGATAVLMLIAEYLLIENLRTDPNGD